MFEYFANHYSWNLAVLMAAQLGGEMSEIDEACRPLQALATRPKEDPQAHAAWIAQWSALARKLQGFALGDETAGHGLTAGKKYLHACVYWFSARAHGKPPLARKAGDVQRHA